MPLLSSSSKTKWIFLWVSSNSLWVQWRCTDCHQISIVGMGQPRAHYLPTFHHPGSPSSAQKCPHPRKSLWLRQKEQLVEQRLFHTPEHSRVRWIFDDRPGKADLQGGKQGKDRLSCSRPKYRWIIVSTFLLQGSLLFSVKRDPKCMSSGI